MNYYKNNKNKLEKLRGIFFQIGLIIAGGITLLAFEWTSPDYIAVLEGDVVEEIEWDYNYVEPFEIIKEEKVEEKAEPPKVKSDEFEIVPDDKKEVEPENKEEKKVIEVPDLGKFKEKEVIVEDEAPRTNAEIMPEFQGGLSELFKFLGDNLKYPEPARRAGIEGKVFLQFTVDKKGEIKDIKILRGVNKLLDEEAIRVVKAMPKWTPGKQSGRPVSVIYNLPINFKLKG